jgi:hypothetical protein
MMWKFCGVRAGDPGAFSEADLKRFDRVWTCCIDCVFGVGVYIETMLLFCKV